MDITGNFCCDHRLPDIGTYSRDPEAKHGGNCSYLCICLVGMAGAALGPGKAQLAEQVQETGSLNKAAAQRRC